MSAESGVFYQHPLPGVYIVSSRPRGAGVKGAGSTIAEALENLQSLWRDMGMVPWEPGKNLIDGQKVVVVNGLCLHPAMIADLTDLTIKQIMEHSR